MIFNKIKKVINKDKRRKVITLQNTNKIDANIVCYFRKTITITRNTPAGDIYTSTLAELETIEGRLIYIDANKIKFIN